MIGDSSDSVWGVMDIYPRTSNTEHGILPPRLVSMHLCSDIVCKVQTFPTSGKRLPSNQTQAVYSSSRARVAHWSASILSSHLAQLPKRYSSRTCTRRRREYSPHTPWNLPTRSGGRPMQLGNVLPNTCPKATGYFLQVIPAIHTRPKQARE